MPVVTPYGSCYVLLLRVPMRLSELLRLLQPALLLVLVPVLVPVLLSLLLQPALLLLLLALVLVLLVVLLPYNCSCYGC